MVITAKREMYADEVNTPEGKRAWMAKREGRRSTLNSKGPSLPLLL
jgi:hypothetical protein